jgi:hypothetical protein
MTQWQRRVSAADPVSRGRQPKRQQGGLGKKEGGAAPVTGQHLVPAHGCNIETREANKKAPFEPPRGNQDSAPG